MYCNAPVVCKYNSNPQRHSWQELFLPSLFILFLVPGCVYSRSFEFSTTFVNIKVTRSLNIIHSLLPNQQVHTLHKTHRKNEANNPPPRLRKHHNRNILPPWSPRPLLPLPIQSRRPSPHLSSSSSTSRASSPSTSCTSTSSTSGICCTSTRTSTGTAAASVSSSAASDTFVTATQTYMVSGKPYLSANGSALTSPTLAVYTPGANAANGRGVGWAGLFLATLGGAVLV
ncbi:hypothetical protein BT63DRAFT_292588 [Microthyrium microscopicum]|uniref:Uncharacterized protein n=1 Tax=Microthyrium microscopicum TaxID=703497 RepID=A0A6A6U570_9PEZI|nr:hypothetical protein BT63DRAFT_292588 [Microthyrium microscopicum]